MNRSDSIRGLQDVADSLKTIIKATKENNMPYVAYLVGKNEDLFLSVDSFIKTLKPRSMNEN